MDFPARTTAQIYAAELGKTITVAALSGYGLMRVAEVNNSHMPKNAKRMALIMEHLRDCMILPECKTDEELFRFVRAYPDLAARIFIQARRLTESLDT